MFYNTNPKVVEAADDIASISSWQYSEENGEKLLAVTFVLRNYKEFDNPSMFHLTDGTQQNMLFAPTPLAEEPAHADESTSTEESTTAKKRSKQFASPVTDTASATDTPSAPPLPDTPAQSVESTGA